jgi:hypothetical protein
MAAFYNVRGDAGLRGSEGTSAAAAAAAKEEALHWDLISHWVNGSNSSCCFILDRRVSWHTRQQIASGATSHTTVTVLPLLYQDGGNCGHMSLDRSCLLLICSFSFEVRVKTRQKNVQQCGRSIGWAISGWVMQCTAELTRVAKDIISRSLSSSFVLLSCTVRNSPALFMHHLFSTFQTTHLLQLNDIMHWTAQDRNLVPLQSNNRGLGWRITPNPFCDWQLYFPGKVKLCKKGNEL